MTRKAGHPSRGSKFGVGVPHQLNHLPSRLLLWFIVLLELVLDMAISAINAERGFEREHYLHQALGGDPPKQLNVLVLLFGAFFFAAGGQGVKRRKLR
jgi:hypothetical protein